MCWDGNLVAVQRLLDDGADANEVERDRWKASARTGRRTVVLGEPR